MDWLVVTASGNRYVWEFGDESWDERDVMSHLFRDNVVKVEDQMSMGHMVWLNVATIETVERCD